MPLPTFMIGAFGIWVWSHVMSLLTRLVSLILSAGPVPRHIAIIMDGNRRFARRGGRPGMDGHKDGFIALKRTLEVCLRMGIECVSVYAFAIDNFKRTQDEVDTLMGLASTKLEELCQQGNLLDQYGVRLNVLGKTNLLPLEVQRIVEKAEAITRNNNKAILNICMPYAARDDMATAVEKTIEMCRSGDLNVEDVTEYDIDSQLYTTRGGSPPLDILIRTSGVERLSDFMLWQACDKTQIQFVSCYWPDFRLRHFVPIILAFQRSKALALGR